MKKFIIIATTILVAVLCSQCGVSSQLKQAQKNAKAVPYTVLENYYVRNDVNATQPHRLVIDNERDFNAYFGPAALMGGLPTDINWKKQFVVAVLLPETDRPTMVTPLQVKQSPGNVIFKYQVNRGRKTSYKLIPFAAIALNRAVEQQQIEVFFIEK